MKIRVYQIDKEKDVNRLAFMSYEFAMEHGWTPKLYDLIFDGDIPGEDLDDIFQELNIGVKPENYKGHSLSVSDVCEVIGDEESEFYYCDSFGWEKIDFDIDKIDDTSSLYEELERDESPCEGCLKYDGDYNCKHCQYGDDGKYSIYDVYRPDELM